jgi:FixJ family two-component response regulator
MTADNEEDLDNTKVSVASAPDWRRMNALPLIGYETGEFPAHEWAIGRMVPYHPGMAPDHIVYIVDDDRRIRESLLSLLESLDMNALAFGSAAEFVAHSKADLAACLILDVELPDMNGLELQNRIVSGEHPHIVFITGHGDIPSSVRAIKAGAVDFLTKPYKQEDLLRAVESALALNREARRVRADLAEFRNRAASLTPRELEVLPLIARGMLSKQAAAELGISESTLQIHRGNVMRKMRAGSLAELVQIAGILGMARAHGRPAKG